MYIFRIRMHSPTRLRYKKDLSPDPQWEFAEFKHGA